jgi:hypothetical protein
MHRKRHTPVAKGFSIGVQIICKLRTTEQFLNQGQTAADVCKTLEVSAPTYHSWQQLLGGMETTTAGGHMSPRP